MKFIITRTSSDKKPCKEVVAEEAIYQDWRTFKNFDEVRKNKWVGEDWFKEGTNHREENGMVVRDLEPQSIWVLELNNIDELLLFVQKYGKIILSESDNWKGYTTELEIYDDYRE